MRSYRVFSSLPITLNAPCELDARSSHYLARVLRIKVGAPIRVFNGDGKDYLGSVASASKNAVSVFITSCENPETEPLVHTTLGLGVSKGDRFEWGIKKATELGVTSVVPILTQRVDVRLPIERWQKKQIHWQNSIISACEQSGRTIIPSVQEPISLDEWVPNIEADCKFVLDPSITSQPVDIKPKHVALLIGPEGGLTPSEVSLASDHGFHGLHLGPRVLRTETAPLVALSIIGARWGDMSA